MPDSFVRHRKNKLIQLMHPIFNFSSQNAGIIRVITASTFF